jgi:hypothetical protein
MIGHEGYVMGEWQVAVMRMISLRLPAVAHRLSLT